MPHIVIITIIIIIIINNNHHHHHHKNKGACHTLRHVVRKTFLLAGEVGPITTRKRNFSNYFTVNVSNVFI